MAKDASRFIFELYHPDSVESLKACKVNSEGAIVQAHHESYLLRAETPLVRSPDSLVLSARRSARSGWLPLSSRF